MIAIKEAKKITTMWLDELVGYLRTFEINLEEAKRERVKAEESIAFTVQLSLQQLRLLPP